MNEKYFYEVTSKDEREQELTRLRVAAWMGQIPSPDPDAAKERRKQKNAEIKKRLAAGDTVYGPVHYTPAMYLQYELTRFKLDYTVDAKACLEHFNKRISCVECPCGPGRISQEGIGQAKAGIDTPSDGGVYPERYPYRNFTEEEKQAFYEENRELFTRDSGDRFSYGEVSMIIEKRLREQEYENIVRDCYSAQDGTSVQTSGSAQHEYSIQDSGSAQHEYSIQNSGSAQHEYSVQVCDSAQHEYSVQACDSAQEGCPAQNCTFPGLQAEECGNFKSGQASRACSQTDKNAGQPHRIYYVSSRNGSDENDGSRKAPFATLFAVNRLQLKPGDQVLLERGCVFRGQFLHLSAWGAKEAPILVGAYGDGPRPRIEAMGQGIWYQDYGTKLDSPTHTKEGYVSSAVLLYDCAYLTLRDIEVTNQGEITGECYTAPHKMNRTGVAAAAKNRGTLREIHLENLEIRDVNGNVYDKHMNNGGIYFTCLKPDDEEATGIARFEGVSITGCFVHRVSRWGIAVGYTYKCKKFMKAELEDALFDQYGHRDIRIANNYVKEAGGDGITVMYALRPLVEHNMADSCAREMNDRTYKYPENRGGKVAAGIWPWKCKDALFQYNEAVDTRLNQDGMAWDADSGDGTIYQYNYSRLNEGGCVMFCLEEAVHNTFRYNISFDDLGGTISPSGNPDAYIHHNTFMKRKGVPFVREHMGGGHFTEEENQVISI